MSALTPEIFAKWPKDRQDAWIRNKEGFIDAIELDRAKMAAEVASIRNQLTRYRTYRRRQDTVNRVLASYRHSVATSQRQMRQFWASKKTTTELGRWKRREILRGMWRIDREQRAVKVRDALTPVATAINEMTRILNTMPPAVSAPQVCKAILDPRFQKLDLSAQTELITCRRAAGHSDEHAAAHREWGEPQTVGYAR